MAPCFPLSFNPHNLPKLPSFLKPFCSPSPLLFHDDEGDAEDSYLTNHHVYTHSQKEEVEKKKKTELLHFFHLQVIILEIRQRAMMKARSQPRSSFMIVTAEELGRLIKAAPKVKKSDDAEELERDEENEEEEFFSVRSCFSMCSSGDEESYLSMVAKAKEKAKEMAMASEEWLRECEGWPFGLWRRRKLVVLPPLPKSPVDSWIWHKRNLSNVRA